MASATRTPSRLEELARLMAERERARALADRRERELSERRRELASLRAEQREYQRAVGAGAKRRPETERRLAEALAEPSLVEREGGPSDAAAELRLEGARAAAEEAEERLRAYCDENLGGLESELTEGLAAERRAVLAAARELARALEPVRQRQRRVAAVYGFAGRSRVPDFVQDYGGLARALAGLERSP